METRTLTVIDIEQWSILFDGEDLIDQGHSIPFDRIVTASKGDAVKLARVSAHGSPFEKRACEAGDVDDSLKLSTILPLTKRGRR